MCNWALDNPSGDTIVVSDRDRQRINQAALFNRMRPLFNWRPTILPATHIAVVADIQLTPIQGKRR